MEPGNRRLRPFLAEAGLVLQLEEGRGARERAVGGGELEVPCCSLSPWPVEFQMDREPLVLLTFAVWSGIGIHDLKMRVRTSATSWCCLVGYGVSAARSLLVCSLWPSGWWSAGEITGQAGSCQGVSLKWQGRPGALGRGVCGHAGQDAVKERHTGSPTSAPFPPALSLRQVS